MVSSPNGRADGPQDAWSAESCEFVLACDGEARITWSDTRAQRRVGAEVGKLLFDLGAPGMEERLRTFFARARQAQTQDIEVPLASDSRIETWTFRGKPDGK